jgi:uncharacterized RDD family membrane protein YckC
MVIPENVELKFEIAGIGSRFAALMLDFVIQIAACGIFSIALLVLLGITITLDKHISGLSSSITVGIIIIVISIILLGYHIILETIMNGQTIGKKVLNIRVRKEQGSALTFWDILLRNFVRLVDVLPPFFIIGLIVMFVNKKSKRLGDFAAGTIVVKEIPRRKLEQFLAVNQVSPVSVNAPEILNAKYEWISSILAFITQTDYLMMKNIISRRRELSNFQQLASEIVRKIIAKASLSEDITFNPNETPEILQEMVVIYEKTYS